MRGTWGTMAAALAVVAPVGAMAAPGLSPDAVVQLSPAHDLSSEELETGDVIDLVVARDVTSEGYVVIPRGTPGRGRVTWRTGKGSFGKSGKMEFDLVDLVIDGRSTPISGHYRIAGQGKAGLTIAMIVVGGLVAGSTVKGDEAVATRTSRWAARTGEPLAARFAADPARGAAGLDPYEAGRRAGQAAVLASAVDY